jgi:hypothetical protein
MTIVAAFVGVAALVAWVTRVADSRGRSALGWAALALVLAVLGFLVGYGIVGAALTADRHSDDLVLLSAIAPIALAAIPVIGVITALGRLPIKTAGGRRWPVAELSGAGAGHLALVPGGVELALTPPRVVALAALERVEVDGECVRLAWRGDDGARAEVLVLPCGLPDTPDGRKQQARTIVARIADHRRGGSVAALPAAKLRA